MTYIGVKSPTGPITFDPNFQQDIQVTTYKSWDDPPSTSNV